MFTNFPTFKLFNTFKAILWHSKNSLKKSKTCLLKRLFEFVEINSRVVAHHANGAQFLKNVQFVGLDFLALEVDIADGLVCGSSDFKFKESRVIAFNLSGKIDNQKKKSQVNQREREPYRKQTALKQTFDLW